MRQIIIGIGITVAVLFAGLVALASAADSQNANTRTIQVEIKNGF